MDIINAGNLESFVVHHDYMQWGRNHYIQDYNESRCF